MSLFTKLRDVVVKVGAPIVGGFIGGPAGAALGSAISASGGAGARKATMQTMLPMPSSGQFGQFPATTAPGGMQQTAGVLPGMGAAARWLISKKGIVSTYTGKLLGVMRGTKLFRNAQVVQLAKQVGLDAAAVALGLTAVEAAQLIAAHLMQGAGKRTRGRGISARDVRTTRRTITKIRSIEHSLSGVCRPRATPRRRSAPAAFIRQG